MKIEQKRIATFCNICRALVPECRLIVTPEGISTLAVDTANVAMVQVNLPKESFEEFREEKTEIGMDVTKWKTAIDLLQDGPITIDLVKTSGKIVFADGRYTYTHVPLDPRVVRKRPNPPNITLPATVVIDSKEFHESIKAMSVIGDKVRFTAKGVGLLTLDSEGDTDRLVKEIQCKDGSKNSAEGGTGTVASLFSLDYMRDIAKVMKEAGTINVYVGHEHPIRFDFDLDGMECSYMLAPRIEQEAA